MSGPPKLPDLKALSADQKDELIVTLYETLLAVEGASQSPATRPTTAAEPSAAAEAASLSQRIASAGPSRRNQTVTAPPATGLRRASRILDSRALQILVLVIGVGLLLDFGVGWYQQRALAAQNRAALELRNAAFGGLYVELTRVVHHLDGKSYRATMFMQNSHTDKPLYILMSPVRVFVQAGLSWREVPAAPPPGTSWGVVKLEGGRDYSVVFEADVKDWAELMPGYMHVRIDSDMLISRNPEPKDDIAERNNYFYVYLKPQGADDEAIKRRSRFPGAPPVFIPMPPH